MVDPNDKKLLELAISRQLVDKKIATEAYHRARKEERSAAEVLVDMGALARHTMEALKRELDMALAPDAITGFRIIRKIGQGGMGSVYLAEQLSLQREVALKVIAPQFAANALAVDRFMREARTAAVVNHPNVISVIDVGYDGGHLYMALELVSGGDAAQLAARSKGVLAEIRALEIISDCCRGLAALHEARLIHRDIKPANIFITRHGIAKLADLGLARSEQGDDGLTVFGHAVGTPAFMSPEQADGKSNVDIRSDIYSLGASLFALTTGSPPFTGNGAYAIVAKLLIEPAPDPRSLNPFLSDATSQVIARCLAKQPIDRYQTPEELSTAIAEVLAANSSAGLRYGTSGVYPPTSAIRPVTASVTRAATDRTNRTHHTPPTARVHKTRAITAKRTPSAIPWPLIGGTIAVLTVVAVLVTTMGQARPNTSNGRTQSASVTASVPVVAPIVGKSAPASKDRPQMVEPVAQPAIQPAIQPTIQSPTSDRTSNDIAIPGLIAYWPLDEASGLQVGDFSGHKCIGVISGATWGTGKLGGALNFFPPSMVVCSKAERLTSVGAITAMCWIKTSQSPKGEETVSVIRHDGHFTALQLVPNGNLHVVTWKSGNVQVAAFPWRGVWDDNRWHHYAVTYHHEDGVRVYKDGLIYAHDQRVTGSLPAKSSAPFVMGGSERGSEYFSGSLDEVRIYDRQLSAAEIQTLAALSAK